METNEMQEWMEDFLHYMQAQKGCSPRTIDTYEIALNERTIFSKPFDSEVLAGCEHWGRASLGGEYAERKYAANTIK